jgi:hypothetical protein
VRGCVCDNILICPLTSHCSLHTSFPIMTIMSSQHLAQLGHSAGTDGAFLGGAGSLGLLASAAAFLSQRTNTLQPAHLLMYGLLLELARRGWDWLYARFTWGKLIKPILS